MHALVGTRRKQ